MGEDNLDIPEEDELDKIDEMVENILAEGDWNNLSFIEMGWESAHSPSDTRSTLSFIDSSSETDTVPVMFQNPVLRDENGVVVGGYLWFDTRDNKLKIYDQAGNVVELATSNDGEFKIVEPQDSKKEEPTEKRKAEDEINNRFDLLDL